ncbi:MAG: FG-GAP repeat protein, partial [Nitrospirota bacterium]
PGWSNGTGSLISCTGPANCSMTLHANSVVTATFALNVVMQFSVTATTATGNGGGGTVACTVNGVTAPCSSYAVGTSISISPTPNSASNFTSWTNGTGSGLRANCNNAPGACTFTLTDHTSITANFNLPTLHVVLAGTGVGTVTSTNVAGINCGASCTATYNKGTPVTLAASTGGGFSGWSGGGCSGTGTCVVTVNADSTVITATFNAGLPPFAQQAYIKASNAQANDAFGESVALSGDTLIVGADSEASNATGINGNQADNSAPNSGAVYVFTRTNGVWTQQAYLKASNTNAQDEFGHSLDFSGDTLVVAAHGEASKATGVNGDQTDNTAPDSGAVYVFTRTNGVWTQQAYIKASNTDAGDEFGDTKALSGDTLAVGAVEASCATGINGDQTNNNCPAAGAVYVLTRTAGVWTQQAYIKASNTDAGDNFGQYVVVSGNTFAVTAQYEASKATGINGNQLDNSAPISGAAYVFQFQ